MSGNNKKRVIACCCQGESPKSGDCKRIAVVDAAQAPDPRTMSPEELLIAHEQFSELLQATVFTREAIVHEIWERYGCLSRCLDCRKMVLSDDAYYLGYWDRIGGNKTTICRACYQQNHGAQPYNSNGSGMYVLVRREFIGEPEFRMELAEPPTGVTLRSAVKKLFEPALKAKFMFRELPLIKTTRQLVPTGSTGFVGHLIVL